MSPTPDLFLAALKLPNLTFGHPWVLLGLLLLPGLALLQGRAGRAPAFVYSSVDLVKPLHRAARSRAGQALLLLRWLTLALLIVALARPRLTESETSVSASGVDIVVAFDVSGSMEAMDFQLKGQDVNRLEMAKEVLKKFVAKRPSDRIGLVAFAGKPYLAAPLTLDHDFLLQNLERLELGTIREDGTAIGSALVTALNRLKELKSKSKIVILMTDGQNNAGKVPPLTAAEAAEALKVKVYTVGVGKRGNSYVLRQFFGQVTRQPVAVDIDEATLTQIADRTGGKYYRADNTERFREIYDEINKLEKTEVAMKKFVRHRELFPWWILGGIAVLLAEVVLGHTIWRKLP